MHNGLTMKNMPRAAPDTLPNKIMAPITPELRPENNSGWTLMNKKSHNSYDTGYLCSHSYGFANFVRVS